MRVTSLEGVAVDGVTEARWGTADVLVKSNRAHANVVVNEYLANRMAGALGVPVPLGDLWFDGNKEPHWVVAVVRDRGIDLPPPSAAIMRKVPEAVRARMVCFDALIQNDDRTDENILVGQSGEAWLIDHDQSLFTDNPDRARFLNARRDQGWRDFGRLWRLAPPRAEAVHVVADQMASLSIDAIVQYTGHLRSSALLSKPEQEAAVDFIRHRRDNIHRLVDPVAVDDGNDGRGGSVQGKLAHGGGDSA
ncbi:hypothetical protein EDD34_3310 [Myceligenerans xiligouense]|uniref:Uncharacterized protein n=1 Tax=Myceligenerans xiligouense TaxID=253184 RepID=A0A3N4ZSC5_9MICO|nr:hypothetical protein EDD34_3310 [Myceligenerans xiligouense]